jgi:hypothetical protein
MTFAGDLANAAIRIFFLECAGAGAGTTGVWSTFHFVPYI